MLFGTIKKGHPFVMATTAYLIDNPSYSWLKSTTTQVLYGLSVSFFSLACAAGLFYLLIVARDILRGYPIDWFDIPAEEEAAPEEEEPAPEDVPI